MREAPCDVVVLGQEGWHGQPTRAHESKLASERVQGDSSSFLTMEMRGDVWPWRAHAPVGTIKRWTCGALSRAAPRLPDRRYLYAAMVSDAGGAPGEFRP
ncbi:MAG: hypothetical protein NVS4B3_22900 [Gemmatimonadaceae bacterium]